MSDAPAKPASSTVRVEIIGVKGADRVSRTDIVATEEPMEVQLVTSDGTRHSIAITMRTPGHDFELAAGFLFTEGIISGRDAIARIRYCSDPQNYNIVTVDLAAGEAFDPSRFSRNMYTSSSCGVCGKTSLDQVRAVMPAPIRPAAAIAPELLVQLPDIVRAQQGLFAKTGGIHAAALFDRAGKLLVLREDVGRHNAMDKLIGQRLLDKKLPAHAGIVLVSGRASFELVQKALMAGIPALAAVGAPSSLAVELATEFGMMLVGFLREGRFNIYSGG